ncbi:MAG: nuclear transport factor 2 family protein [Acidobacteriota bacterium]|nr:nuclear transport factor 2 family protein [Acidobacteriota bacterium]
MTATANKQLMENIFSELAQGNSRRFVESMADDIRWRVMGTTPWSKTYEGKRAVLTDLLGELRARLADRYRATAQLIIAEGDRVVVQASGQATTKNGAPYNNEYCFIYRISEGQIREVTEYLDTELLTRALGNLD